VRACMVAYTFYEKDGRVMMYANALRERGDEVEVISLRYPGQSTEGFLNGVHVRRIQERPFKEKGRLSYLYPLLKFLVKSSLLLMREHKRKPYDVIHVHSVPDFEVFSAWFPKLKGAKIILDIHDIVPEFYAAKFKAGKGSLLYKMLILVEKISIAFSDHVIIANHIWERTLRRSVNGRKCSVFLNYPDPALFYRRPRVRNDGKFILIYPGTLNWHQGLDIAIQAFNRIKDEVPNAEFHIYGRGGAEESLEKLIEERGLQGRVLMKGILPTKQIADMVANADLGVVPKRNDSFGGEAFSTKTLEFMSLGVPAIVSATKIDKFYFNDEVMQFFTPEDDQDLAEKMLLLIKNKGLRERLAQNALRFVADYSWDHKKQEYLTLVDSLVRKG
jgi:glycosyltransferase involved in cell wall biosynthesis